MQVAATFWARSTRTALGDRCCPPALRCLRNAHAACRGFCPSHCSQTPTRPHRCTATRLLLRLFLRTLTRTLTSPAGIVPWPTRAKRPRRCSAPAVPWRGATSGQRPRPLLPAARAWLAKSGAETPVASQLRVALLRALLTAGARQQNPLRPQRPVMLWSCSLDQQPPAARVSRRADTHGRHQLPTGWLASATARAKRFRERGRGATPGPPTPVAP